MIAAEARPGRGARLDGARALLDELGAAALLVTAPANVRWLSEFGSPEDGRVLVTNDEAWLLTDARYTAQAEEQSLLPPVIERDWVGALRGRVSGGRLAVEAEHLTLAGAEALRSRLQMELVPTQGRLEALRLHKDADELERIRRAAEISDAALQAGVSLIRPGMREAEIALAIERAMRLAGADAPAFTTVVASGPRGGMPHGVASLRELQDGELVTIDLGARYRGYCSDMTRTFAVGSADAAARHWYRAVEEAQADALRAVAAGVAARDVDAAARDRLAAHELDEAFVHSLGHGVGLEVHEGPRLSSRSDEVLAAGMVLTVEPGVYLPGQGGVRIEDLVLVTDDGHELLSHAPKPPVAPGG